MELEIVKADYLNQKHGEHLVRLLNEYATGEMGGAKPLAAEVQANLLEALSKLPYAFSLLAYVDGEPAGLANCFLGFSTFKCKPLVNIHDIMVSKAFRGRNISQHLLGEIEAIAMELGCCKITLEVLEGNEVAKKAYAKFGFLGYELDPATGKALFWEKMLQLDC